MQEELIKIFDSKNFMKAKRPHQFWGPLLLLFTGARANEIACLDLDDVITENGILCISIKHRPRKKPDTIEHKIETKRVKNSQSRRTIPLHPKLWEIGFGEYLEDLKSLGATRIFPNLPMDSREKRERNLSRDVNNYLKEVGVHIPRTKVLHSFRDTVSDALGTSDLDAVRADQGSVRYFVYEPVEIINPKEAPVPTTNIRHGRQDGPPDVRLVGGYFIFDSPDAGLLVSLLPALVHLRNAERLSTLVRLVAEEASIQKAGRDLVLTRLVDVLLVEALRSTSGKHSPPGLLRGLADACIALAMQLMHGHIAHAWTVAQLAKEVALSRSAFFDRFTRTAGLPPMEYLLAWRMAIAKDLLLRLDTSIAEVAEHVGYSSSSTFSTAFSRHVGLSPSRYARERQKFSMQIN